MASINDSTGSNYRMMPYVGTTFLLHNGILQNIIFQDNIFSVNIIR